MNTIELQNSIIRKILNTSDNQLLDYLNNLLAKGESPDFYKLNDFEKNAIQESLVDYKNGKIITNDDVFAKSKKWLDE